MRAKLGMPAKPTAAAAAAPSKTASSTKAKKKCSECQMVHPQVPCSFCGSSLPDDEFDVGTAEAVAAHDDNDAEGDDDDR
jgi:hypothetical protein